MRYMTTLTMYIPSEDTGTFEVVGCLADVGIEGPRLVKIDTAADFMTLFSTGFPKSP